MADYNKYGGKKSFGDSKARRFDGKKSYGEKKSYGDRKEFGERKFYGDKKRNDRDFRKGDNKKSFGDKKDFGEKRSFSGKPEFKKERFVKEKKYDNFVISDETVEMAVNNEVAQEGSIGEDIIIGRNPISEALKSGREIDTIFVQNEAGDGPIGKILGMAKERQIPVRRVPKRKLDELAKPFASGNTPANHQGICAKVAMVKYASIEDIFALAEKKAEKPFIIALDGITDPHNLGAIVRSAEVFGAHGVIIPKNRSASMNAAAVKSASGAEEYIPVAKVANLAQAIDELKARNVFIAGADMEGVAAKDCDMSGALCIVIGSEGEGISKLIRQKCDFMVKIDVLGKVDSLNASCAAAVLMYEKRRQM